MRRRLPPPWALTALAALVYAALAPPTTDLAAQSHRVTLARDGVWLFDLSWFGGHHLPGYSVLMPVLGLALGPAVISALSGVLAAWAFGRLARPLWPGTGGAVASWWFAAGVGGLLFTGRTTFLLGTALALVALLAARPGGATARRAVLGALGAALTALASPVAALFLTMVASAWWLADLRRAGGRGEDPVVPLAVAGAALLTAGALSAAFPTGGSEPFVASALWPAVALLGVAFAVLPREHRAVRIGVALYLAGVLLAGALPTPMGGNATRLAALAGGPLIAAALWGRRPVALALLTLPLVYWQWYPPVRDASQAWADHSARASYWAPVQDELERRLAGAPARIEVVPTVRRGEARWITPEVPLARGWIRQLDRDRSPLFYDDLDGPPSAAAYRAWLDDEAVSWVVLTDAEPDHASKDEAELLRAGRIDGLHRVTGGDHWTLWRVDRPRPLVTWASGGRGTTGGRRATGGRGATGERGAGTSAAVPRVTRADPGSLTFEAPRGGLVDVRIRWSPYLRARGGRACVTRGPGGWTLVRARIRDTVTLDTAPAVPWRRPGPQDCST